MHLYNVFVALFAISHVASAQSANPISLAKYKNLGMGVIDSSYGAHDSSSSCPKDIHSLNLEFMWKESLVLKKVSMVSMPRLIGTFCLCKAALHLAGGDFVETGVYNGGTAALLAKTLINFDTCDRKFWGFDSWDGFPAPAQEDLVGELKQGKRGDLNASIEDAIKVMTAAGGYNTNTVRLVKGFFADTCPKAPVKKIAFLRLDGDMFVSTWDAIDALYDRVLPGGYIYVDDYGSYNGCSTAINKYRAEHGITDTMFKIYERLPVHNDPGGLKVDPMAERPLRNRPGYFEAVWWKKGSGRI